ncbi:MAG: hypothetical protein ABR510_06110 [Trueperaceae bacterium]
MIGRRRPRRPDARGTENAAAVESDRRRIATSPQVLLSALALVLAALYAATSAFGPASPALPGVPVVAAVGAETETLEVRFVVVDEQGLERPAFADAVLARDQAEDPGARLTAALEALRTDRVASGAWPASVAAPTAFVFELDRRRVAVVDVGRPGPDEGVTVAQEWAVLRSVVATAGVEVAADAVHITVEGAPADAFWGHVALPPESP